MVVQSLSLPPDAIEVFAMTSGEARPLVVERHRSIAPVTNHVDVSHFVVEWDAVDRQMTFSKAAMSLLIKTERGLLPGRRTRARQSKAICLVVTGNCILKHK